MMPVARRRTQSSSAPDWWMPQMMKAGIWLNLSGILVITALCALLLCNVNLSQKFASTSVCCISTKATHRFPRKGELKSVQLRHFVYVFAVIAVALMGAAHGAEPLRAEPESLKRAAPELIERLRANPYTFFRFVNRPWIARVCDDLGSDLRDLPVVRLHGDAHVEQFAIAQNAWGLDDFDDSARGPAAIDIVRFLGSIDLVARQRSWEKDRDRLFDRFVEGYKRGLAEPHYLPGPPDVVRGYAPPGATDTRGVSCVGRDQMKPLADVTMKALVAAIEAFARVVLRERPDLTPDTFAWCALAGFRAALAAP